MTTMQPRTAMEAAQLGLLMPNIPRGIFGSGRRRLNNGYTPGRDGTGAYGGVAMSPPLDPAAAPGMQPPPISDAPPPPADWKKTLGATLVSQLPQMAANNGLQMEQVNPAPSMRGGSLGNRGMFGSMPMAPTDAMMSDKISNRGAPPIDDANGKGKKGIDWRMIAGIVGDGLLGLNGQPGIYGPNMWRLRQQQAEHQDRIAQMREQARIKLAEPDYATVNNRRVRIDPTTGRADVLYEAPQDFEDYAASLGAEPGSPEFERLVQDYVLRGSGPTATDNYNTREEWRQDNRLELESERQGNRIGLQDRRQAGQRALKATPTYRQANPLPPRSGGRSGGSGGGIREGQTATNPQTGAKVVYRGGKWVPAK
ncbi:MAG: hypothetical protein JNN10_04590 [Sphingopyxis sp.]|uniref:hypothetical protein n=1 Tax=Sphingopyxis sp. TaxID=1908224 RepID=UPI001A6305CA|nr:hypothetical protein [Sphingopyxis sp.]MBL9065553.1 hypothetical protein [Sphingopyxis sp.]